MASRRVIVCKVPATTQAMERPIAVVVMLHHAGLAFSGEMAMKMTTFRVSVAGSILRRELTSDSCLQVERDSNTES